MGGWFCFFDISFYGPCANSQLTLTGTDSKCELRFKLTDEAIESGE